MNIQIRRECLKCGAATALTVDLESYNAWKSGTVIQEAFPDSDSFFRECLLTGMCYDCQSKLFNKPKPGEDWGEEVGECEICGAPIYQHQKKCASCGAPVPSPFLQPLAKELELKHPESLMILASLVYGTLNSNRCGVTGDNIEAIEDVLASYFPNRYTWEIYKTAGYCDNELFDVMCEHEPHIAPHEFYKNHVWPYLREHEIVPGVKMQD